MKTIKDLKADHINRIYSIIIGREREAEKINWTPEKDFVCAVFKVEECKTDDRYDYIEYGIQITAKLQVNFVWYWKNERGTAIEYRPLYNHHQITKYMIDEGFDV